MATTDQSGSEQRMVLLAGVDLEAQDYAATLPTERLTCSKCGLPMVALASLKAGRCLWCRPWKESEQNEALTDGGRTR